MPFFAEMATANWVNVLLDFRSNLINWCLLVALIWWLCAKYLPPFMAQRREFIESELAKAAKAKEEAFTYWNEQKRKMKEANAEAEHIIAEAERIAGELRTQIEKQTLKDLVDLEKKFDVYAANERQLAVSQMRSLAVRAAVNVAESVIRESMTSQTQSRVLNQFIEQLDNAGEPQTVATTGQFERIR